jgi:hypothetical protein
MLVFGVALVLTAMLAGCGGQSTTYSESTAAAPAAEPAAQPASEAAMPASFEMTEELGAKLAAADLVDGEADMVVSKCPGCALAMEGSHEHALPVGEYSLHFCSDKCQEQFSDDLEASVVALAIPED